jgi:hypothetical protein
LVVTQLFAAFNPVDTNFYEDAYTKTEGQREVIKFALKLKKDKEASKKKRYVKVIWSYEVEDGTFVPYSKFLSKQIERSYRKQKKPILQNRLFHLIVEKNQISYHDSSLQGKISQSKKGSYTCRTRGTLKLSYKTISNIVQDGHEKMHKGKRHTLFFIKSYTSILS